MKLVGLHDYVITLENENETIVDHDNLFYQGKIAITCNCQSYSHESTYFIIR